MTGDVNQHGGYVVPRDIEEAVYDMYAVPNPLRRYAPRLKRKPLTIRQRVRLWRYDFVRWLHDRLFGAHHGDDWDD